MWSHKQLLTLLTSGNVVRFSQTKGLFLGSFECRFGCGQFIGLKDDLNLGYITIIRSVGTLAQLVECTTSFQEIIGLHIYFGL